MRVVKKQKIERFPNAAFFLARKCSWSGVQFPYGTIRGARPWVSHETLLIFARFAHNLAECGRSADAWNRPYVDLPSFHSPDHTTGRGKSDSCNLVMKNVYVHLHTHALHNGHVGLGCQYRSCSLPRTGTDGVGWGANNVHVHFHTQALNYSLQSKTSI